MMDEPRRTVTFTHARRIAGYNWPLYAAALGGVLVGVVVALFPGSPPALRWVGAFGAAGAAWFACSSFLAFHWMFDRSPLLSGQWLVGHIVPPPRRWVQINAGLEETTVPLAGVFPGAAGMELDIYDPAAMTSSSSACSG